MNRTTKLLGLGLLLGVITLFPALSQASCKERELGLRPIVSLSFFDGPILNAPTSIRDAKIRGSNKRLIYFANQSGLIYQVDPNDSSTLAVWLDLTATTVVGLPSEGLDPERGLVSFAFNSKGNKLWVWRTVELINPPDGLPDGQPQFLGTLQNPVTCEDMIPGQPNSLDPYAALAQQVWEEPRADRADSLMVLEQYSIHSDSRATLDGTILRMYEQSISHHGVNSLYYDACKKVLLFGVGDSSRGWDPANLAATDDEIHGKLMEIQVKNIPFLPPDLVVTRFSELPKSIARHIKVLAKGIRNPTGIDRYTAKNGKRVTVVANCAQNACESFYAFDDQCKMLNFGWRPWEGVIPVVGNLYTTENYSVPFYQYDGEFQKTIFDVHFPLFVGFHHETRDGFIQSSDCFIGAMYYNGKISALKNHVIASDFSSGDFVNARPVINAVKAPCKNFDTLRKQRQFTLSDTFEIVAVSSVTSDHKRIFIFTGDLTTGIATLSEIVEK